MWRRGFVAVLGLVALAACEPANDAQRLTLHWQTCQAQTSLPAARVTACTQVIDAPNVAIGQKVQALLARGMLRVELKQDVRAFSDFGQALRFDAQNAAAHIQRGLLHQKRGAFGAAIVDFDAADRIDDASAGADYAADALNAEMAAYQTQIAELDARIAADGKNASLYNNRCWLRAIVGQDLDGALNDCNTALNLAPNTGQYLDSRGLVELKLGDYAGAARDYDAALANDADDTAHFLYGRALARAGLGMQSEAVADIAQARSLQPDIDGFYKSYGVRVPRS